MKRAKEARSDARLLLEAYELVGVVEDGYLDTIEAYGEKERLANSKEARDAWAQKQEDIDKVNITPLDDIRTALLKALVNELDEATGRISWIE